MIENTLKEKSKAKRIDEKDQNRWKVKIISSL